jgi:hypothetical protein
MLNLAQMYPKLIPNLSQLLPKRINGFFGFFEVVFTRKLLDVFEMVLKKNAHSKNVASKKGRSKSSSSICLSGFPTKLFRPLSPCGTNYTKLLSRENMLPYLHLKFQGNHKSDSSFLETVDLRFFSGSLSFLATRESKLDKSTLSI